jgi:2,3-dihydroxy-2,3-dihydrophenylpropionate dehydrogenase
LNWLEGHTALVTGGSSGIGRAVVDAFVQEGARVGVLGTSAARLADVQRAHGQRVVTIRGDATRLDDDKRAVAETVRAFGKLDTLVCNQGVFDYYLSLLDLPEDRLADAFDEIFAVNVKSYLLAAKAALPALLETEGSIILTLSTAAFYSEGAGILYGASKWATRGIVHHLAYQLAPKVRVNGVAPGGTGHTKLRGLRALGQQTEADQVPGRDERIRAGTPMQVLALPEDHAWAYVYLASKARSRIVTGAVVNTDGGRGVAGVARLAGLVP